MNLRTAIFFLLTCPSLYSFGQSVLRQNKDSAVQSNDNLSLRKIAKMDSVAEYFNNKINEIQPANLDVRYLADSIPPNAKKYNEKLDSAKGKLKHSMDSLSSLKLPTGKYENLLDSLEKTGLAKNVKEAEEKLNSLQSKINEPGEKLNQSISSKQQKINGEIERLHKDAGLDLPSVTKSPNSKIPPLNIGKSITDLSTVGLPDAPNSLKNVSNVGVSGGLSSIQKEIKDVGIMPMQEINQLKNTSEVTGIQEEIREVGKIGQQARGYEEDVKNIATGDLNEVKQFPKEIEQRAVKLEGIKELQGQSKEFEKYKSLANNPDGLKKLGMQEVRKEAVNHFAGKEQALISALGEVSKYKIKYPNAAMVKDLTKPVRNAMYGKPLIERFVPAIAFQIRVKNDVLIDFNPMIGYRLSGTWIAGLGWVERAQFHQSVKTVPEGRIYGLRAFTDIKWKKGVSLRGEIERINLLIPPNVSSPSDASRQWTWGFFAGLKKDYKFFKGVNGNIQVLYNLNQFTQNNSPYTEKISFRMGFEFPLRKRR